MQSACRIGEQVRKPKDVELKRGSPPLSPGGRGRDLGAPLCPKNFNSSEKKITYVYSELPNASTVKKLLKHGNSKRVGGRRPGPKPRGPVKKFNTNHALQLRADGLSMSTIGKIMGVSTQFVSGQLKPITPEMRSVTKGVITVGEDLYLQKLRLGIK